MRQTLLGAVTVAVMTATVSVMAAASPPAVRAGVLKGKIHLDGRLDEKAWASAGLIPNLTQQDPHPGKPTPYTTEVRFLVDSSALYVGIRCFDPHPEEIAIHTMQRDGNMRGDDSVALVLDTFGDHRTAFFFQINAAATRQDGLIAGPESFSLDWDGIWYARTHRDAEGWTAEIIIPAQTLRFTPGKDVWGLNVERLIPRDRTTLRWAGHVLDASFFDLRRAGKLFGMADLRQGKGLSVSPYGLVRSQSDLETHHSTVQGDAGLDVTYNLTPDLTGVLSLNTDFAETEVDTRQINLTRFALFFPEKRSFFLEGSNLFQFGTGLDYDFIPFFSRRVGLYQGNQVPMLGGVKLLGRSGKWGIGVLDAVTGKSGETEQANLFAGRVTYDVDRHLTVGTIVTDGDPDGVHDNTLVGVDAAWRTSTFRGDKNLSVGGWAATSAGDVPDGQKYGWGFNVSYPNDLWDLFLTVKEFGDAMDPALGFLPRPGTRWYQGGGAYQPRPTHGAFAWVRQMFFELFTNYVEDLDGHAESWRVFMTPFNVETESGEHFETNAAPQFERLDEPFEVADGVVIPAGEYHFTRFRVEAQSSRHRPWRVGGKVWFGDFYTGSLTQWETFATYTTPAGHLQLELTAENDFGHLPQGDFIQRLWGLKTVYAFTPDLVLSAFGQYDSVSGDLGVNARFRWTIQPGNDLFVVWNHGWKHPVGGGGNWTLQPMDNELVVKLRWTFRR